MRHSLVVVIVLVAGFGAASARAGEWTDEEGLPRISHPGPASAAAAAMKRSRSAAGATNAVIEGALSWAKEQPGTPWFGQGLSFVATAFDVAGEHQRDLDARHATSARAAFEHLAAQGRIREGEPPRGAIVFYDWTAKVNGVTKNWGHVAISNGDRTVVSSPLTPGGPIERALALGAFGTPIGWTMPR